MTGTARLRRPDMGGSGRILATCLDPAVLPPANEESHPRGVYGAHQAIRGSLQAVVRWSSFDEIRFYAPASRMDDMRDPIDALATLPGGDRVSIHPLRTLGELLRDKGDRVTLHDFGNLDGGDLLYLRRKLSDHAVPLTMAHMTLSYAHLRATVLDLLLLGPSAADAVVASSVASALAARSIFDAVGAQLGRGWPGRFVVVPFGVDCERFQAHDRRASRQRLGLPLGDTIILSLGRFSPFDKADLEPLLRAFGRVCHSVSRPVRLVLAGDDKHGYVELVRQLVGAFGLDQQVEIRPDIAASALPGYYAAADMFVAPSDSIQESFGLTLLEAMASGIPVIASDWNGYRDLVVDGDTGYLVPTLTGPAPAWLDLLAPANDWIEDHFLRAQSVVIDDIALGIAMRRLIDDPARASALGRSGRQRAETCFGWRSVVERLEALWADLAEVARGVAWEPAAATYRDVDHTAAFGHFATRLIDGGTVIRRNAVTGPSPADLVDLYGLGDHLDLTYVDSVLASLEDRAERLDALLDRSASPDAARWHILWLLKHGYARVAAVRS